MPCKILISFLALLFTAAPALADVVVIVRREAQSAGNYVRICDIARVDGPENQAREVAMTVIGPAPARGESHEITRWDIESRLYEMGVAARVTFSGNDTVTVMGGAAASRPRPDQFSFVPLGDVQGRPSGGSVEKPGPVALPARKPEHADGFSAMDADAKKRVAGVIADYLAGRYRQGERGRDDVEVEARLIGSSGPVPYFAHLVEVKEAVSGRVPGRATLRLVVRDDADAPEREVTVSADTDVFGRALVAARNVKSGESLASRDVKVARVKMESGKAYLPPRPAAVVGREAGKAIKSGDVIFADDAIVGEAVKRGQLVIVDTVGRGWRVQAKAKAHGSGSVGDIIEVEDTDTRTKYAVRITGRGTGSVVVNKEDVVFGRKTGR